MQPPPPTPGQGGDSSGKERDLTEIASPRGWRIGKHLFNHPQGKGLGGAFVVSLGTEECLEEGLQSIW